MRPMCPHVTYAQHHIGGQFALHVQTPLLDIRIPASLQKPATCALAEELIVVLFHLIDCRYAEIGCNLTELKGWILTGKIGVMIPKIIGKCRGTDGAILSSKSDADAVAVNQVIASTNDRLLVREWCPGEVEA